jgi:hypothetical protein
LTAGFFAGAAWGAAAGDGGVWSATVVTGDGGSFVSGRA